MILIFNSGCFLNSKITSTGSGSQQSNGDPPATPALIKKLSLPTSVPEGFPYYGKFEVQNATTPVLYQFAASTCNGVSINSTTGIVSGDIELLNSETCSYSLKATVDNTVLTSDVVTVTGTPSLNVSFSMVNLIVAKGAAGKTQTLSFSPPAPFDSYLSYDIYSSNGNSVALESFSSNSSQIFVAAGSTQVNFNVEVKSTSPLSSSDYLVVKLKNGSSGSRGSFPVGVYDAALPTFDQIALGNNTTCGITSGKLYCWGSDEYGRLGNGAPADTHSSTPVRIGSSTSWTWIALGEWHSCGIDGGKLYCWGYDSGGILGNGVATADVLAPEQIGISTTWQKVALGRYQSCGINAGNMYCWGTDGSGQIGNGATTGNMDTPQLISSTGTWTAISSGYRHNCGIDAGKLYCWGSDLRGEQGNGATAGDVLNPTQVGVLTNWQMVSASGFSSTAATTCGIESGKLFCWGSDIYGLIGNGNASTANVLAPEQVETSATWSNISVGNYSACGINLGHLYCWGQNEEGFVGLGTNSVNAYTSPQLVGEETNWSSIEVGSTHVCGLIQNYLSCWGTNSTGEVGLPSIGSASPKKISDRNGWTEIDGGDQSHFCGILAGQLFCWGVNIDGQLGTGNVIELGVPEKIGLYTDWQKVSVGFNSSCGIRSGQLFCWGSDDSGQLGNGALDSADALTPQRIGTSQTWQDISLGIYTSCGIDAGKLYCWGANSSGKVGNGIANATPITEPYRVGTSVNWTKISVGWANTCGIDGGKLNCWGEDINGQVGNGSGASTTVTSPEQIGILDWTYVTVSKNQTCGVSSGQLYCWGQDSAGQVGNGSGSSANVHVPELIGASNAWTMVEGKDATECGLASGSLFCWGSDFYLQLGNGTSSSANVTAPEQIGSLGNWQKISGSAYGFCGIAGGDLYCWGTDRSIPHILTNRPTPLLPF